MRAYTVAWLVAFAYVVILEIAALLSREYENTGTWHLREVMLAHPVLAWLVPALFLGLALHVVMEYTLVVLRP